MRLRDLSPSDNNISKEPVVTSCPSPARESAIKPIIEKKLASNPIIDKNLRTAASALSKRPGTLGTQSLKEGAAVHIEGCAPLGSTTPYDVPSVQTLAKPTSLQPPVALSSMPSSRPLVNSKTIFGPFSPQTTSASTTPECSNKMLAGSKEIPKPFRVFNPPGQSPLCPTSSQAPTLLPKTRSSTNTITQPPDKLTLQVSELKPQFKPGQQQHMSPQCGQQQHRSLQSGKQQHMSPESGQQQHMSLQSEKQQYTSSQSGQQQHVSPQSGHQQRVSPQSGQQQLLHIKSVIGAFVHKQHMKAPVIGASGQHQTIVTRKDSESRHGMSDCSLSMEQERSDASLPTRKTTHVHNDKQPANNMSSGRSERTNTEASVMASKRKQVDGVENGSRFKKSRLRKGQGTSTPNWPNEVMFDEKEEVITIDAEGNEHIMSGLVHPRDVWNNTEVRYIVHFNNFNQPIRKGGDILVKFLGDVAKKERFCPLGAKNWHQIHKINKAKIIKLGHFVIPTEEVLNKGLLHRVDKSWRQHKYNLKNAHFKLDGKTIDQIYDQVPDGVTRDNLIRLVDYWNSSEGQKLSELGKSARASQAHTHTSGATSFANRRADFEEENEREPTELEFFKITRSKKDGSFVDRSLSGRFVVYANSKVEEALASSSSSKSKFDIENEVFDDLMYQGEIPKRPINYGFGVKQSDIFGVQGLLRKEGLFRSNNNALDVENLKHAYSTMKKENEELKKQNQDLATKFDENTQVFKTIAAQMAEVLNAVRSGKVPNELLEGAQSAMRVVASQVPDASSGYMNSKSGSNPLSSEKPI